MPPKPTDKERLKQARYDKLAQKAKGDAGFQALADHLVKEQDFNILEVTLGALDASDVPKSPPTPLDWGNLSGRRTAVYGLVPIFLSLLFTSVRNPTPGLEAYKQKAMEILLEGWEGVIQWMNYLINYSPQYGQHKKVCQDCADALHAMLARPELDPMRLELISVPGTGRLIYHLLSQQDVQTGKCIILDIPGSICSMPQLLIETSSHEAARDVMRLEWESQGPKTRRKQAGALLGRVQQMAEKADSKNMVEIAESISCFLTALLRLFGDPTGLPWRDVARQGFLSKWAQALTDLADKAQRIGIRNRKVWDTVSSSMLMLVDFTLVCTPNPNRNILQLIEGGIIRCATLCLPWDSPSLRSPGKSCAIRTLEIILPFLTIEKVYNVVDDRGDFDFFHDNKDNPNQPPKVKDICLDMRVAAVRGRRAFLTPKSAKLNICNNSKIQDWSEFHSEECKALCADYKEYKSDRLWAHFPVWRDHLVFIETLSNRTLPPLPEYRALEIHSLGETLDEIRKATTPGMRIYPPEAAISVFDMVAYDNPWPIHLHKLSLNTYRATWDLINSVLDPRIQKCVDDALAHPNKFILVEGVFAFTENRAMYVFVKMGYDPNAPSQERYKVVNSVFRVGRRYMTYGIIDQDDLDPTQERPIPVHATPVKML
ncbi:hypothetical protein NMY22_g11465 [Coprinellus aureogranulatus]|nr:hypothetical protein NMY22_g11465 [Coprinellus aureogranulatus]